ARAFMQTRQARGRLPRGLRRMAESSTVDKPTTPAGRVVPVKAQPSSLTARCLAECLGTFLLVLFGLGAVHVYVLLGALSGLWQVAIVWGVAIMLAVFAVGAISGAHINPAISVALAVWGRFPWAQVVPYVLAQFTGAFLAAAVLFALYHPFLEQKERDEEAQGRNGKEFTKGCYGEYFPRISEPAAFAAETLGTAILALAVFALTDER